MKCDLLTFGAHRFSLGMPLRDRVGVARISLV